MTLSEALAGLDGRDDVPERSERAPRGGRRGGRGRGRGKEGGRGGDSREVKISRKLSSVLRHNAEKEGFKLDEGGFINVSELLSWHVLRSMQVTWADIQQVVADNDKQRFELQATAGADPDDPARFRIRAKQGHSLAVASENLLAPLVPGAAGCPAVVVHGTSNAAWTKIKASGALSRMARGHVHFAVGSGDAAGDGPALAEGSGLEAGDVGGAAVAEAARNGEAPRTATAPAEPLPVVSGMRASSTVLVWVDVAKAARAGLKWWRSGNGVVLSEGDDGGLVSLDFVTRVERRKGAGREVIWRPGWQ